MKKQLLMICVSLIMAILVSVCVYTHDSVQQTQIPRLYLEGDISQMNDKTDIRQVTFRYLENGKAVTGFADLRAQGNWSMRYLKKNYYISLYQNAAHTEKLKINVGWGKQNKFCLKANWVDRTHARNLVTAKLTAEAQQKYNVFSNTPNYGTIAGFPIEVYANGEFLGLYTLNMAKGAWQFGMDSGNPNHIVFGCEDWGPGGLFWAEPDATMWALEIGEDNEETWDKLRNLYDFIMNSSDQVFVADFEKHLDLDAMLNYYVIADFAYLRDNCGKNVLLATYDGEKWYPCLYDMDTSWGVHYDGLCVDDYENEGVNLSVNHLFSRLEDCYGDKIAERYWELRETILTKEHIMEEFAAFAAMIPQETFEKEQERWGSEIPGFGYDQIEAYLDVIIPKLDRKYQDRIREPQDGIA